MKVYVYLDESGSIHKNSKSKYFAVGGYIAFEQNKNKIKSNYKKINKKIKDSRNIGLDVEIKSFNMTEEEKINIFDKMQNIKNFLVLRKCLIKIK